MKKEIQLLTHWLADILDDIHDVARLQKVREEVIQLCREFPVYS